MSTAEKIVYGETNEVSIPLNQETHQVQPQKKGCTFRTKLAVGAAVLVALGLGTLGLCLGLKEEKVKKMPGYSVKYVVSSNTTNGLMSLASAP